MRIKLSVHFAIQEQLLDRNVQRFRGGLLFKAHRLLYHSTLGIRVIQKKKKVTLSGSRIEGLGTRFAEGLSDQVYGKETRWKLR